MIKRVIFAKNPNYRIKMRILTYIPDKEYIMQHKAEMKLNSIKKVQHNFIGYIEYRGLDDKLLKILRVKDGRVVRRYIPKNCVKCKADTLLVSQ